MTTVAGFVTTVSLALIIAGIFSMVTPESSTRKVFHSLLCIFLLIAILGPVASGFDLDFELEEIEAASDAENIEQINEVLYEQLERTADDEVKNQIEGILAGLEISSAKIQIIMDRTEDSRIQISQVDIYLVKEDSHKQDAVKSMIKNELGLKAEVYAE